MHALLEHACNLHSICCQTMWKQFAAIFQIHRRYTQTHASQGTQCIIKIKNIKHTINHFYWGKSNKTFSPYISNCFYLESQQILRTDIMDEWFVGDWTISYFSFIYFFLLFWEGSGGGILLSLYLPVYTSISWLVSLLLPSAIWAVCIWSLFSFCFFAMQVQSLDNDFNWILYLPLCHQLCGYKANNRTHVR